MICRSPPRRVASPGSPSRWDDRAIGHRESRQKNARFATSTAEKTWSLRRAVVSTVSVNTVLWILTAFVFWWAYSL